MAISTSSRFPRALTFVFACASAAFAVGCQSNPSADATLPPPSFDQPRVVSVPAYHPTYYTPAPPPPPAYTYVAPHPAPAYPSPRIIPPAIHHANAGPIPAAWIPPVAPRPWKWIVIHHTATSFGNEAIVNQWHLDRGFDEMGYHFLIGNGSRSGDGQVEVGPRWPKQKWGAHTKTPDNRYNDFGIGICLVGNFDVGYPTANQMKAVDKLVAYLMKTYNIPPDHVLGHGDCKQTDCPGKHFSVATVRNSAVRILADEGDNIAEPAIASAGELMKDVDSK